MLGAIKICCMYAAWVRNRCLWYIRPLIARARLYHRIELDFFPWTVVYLGCYITAYPLALFRIFTIVHYTRHRNFMRSSTSGATVCTSGRALTASKPSTPLATCIAQGGWFYMDNFKRIIFWPSLTVFPFLYFVVVCFLFCFLYPSLVFAAFVRFDDAYLAAFFKIAIYCFQ